jgi:hypothetical protein
MVRGTVRTGSPLGAVLCRSPNNGNSVALIGCLSEKRSGERGRFLARFGKGVDPGTGSTGNQTLGQLYSNRDSTTTHSLPPVPPPHRPQPHAMLTVRSPLPRNASEIIHERPGRVLHGAAVDMCQFDEPAPAPLACVRRRSWRRPVCAVFLSIHAMLAGVSHRMASQNAKGGAD